MVGVSQRKKKNLLPNKYANSGDTERFVTSVLRGLLLLSFSLSVLKRPFP